MRAFIHQSNDDDDHDVDNDNDSCNKVEKDRKAHYLLPGPVISAQLVVVQHSLIVP